MFADQLRIEGAVDISDKHAFLRGSFHFKPALNVAAGLPVLELDLDTEGRLGPGRHFLLAGTGGLKLLGKTFTTVSGELSPDGISLEANLSADSAEWKIKGFPIQNAELALRGHIDLAGPLPDVSFEGNGRLQIADVHIAGRCRINAGAGHWCLGASGSVNWQGRDWLQGAIELCNDRLTVQGRTEFALDLTPNQLPANIQIAGLVLNVSVGGSFSVRSSGRIAACSFDLQWTLAVKLPGSHANQSLPIASQRLPISLPSIPSSNSVTLIDLINIDGLTLFSLEGVSIPVPTISPTESTEIYLHPQVSINPAPFDLPFQLVTIDPGPSDDPNDPIPLTPLYSFTPSVNVPAFTLPIPVLSDSPPDSNPNQDPLLSIPWIGIDHIPLSGELRLDQLQLGLQLRWKDGKLGIWVIQSQQFVPFDSLPQLLTPGVLIVAQPV